MAFDRGGGPSPDQRRPDQSRPDRPWPNQRCTTFVVHSLAHARAALAAAAQEGTPVTLVSPPGAAAYLGVPWFRELIDMAAEPFPDVGLEAVLDCGDQPGFVLAALRAGCKVVCFGGSRATARRLSEIAEAQGARLITRRPAGLDLLDQSDPAAACEAAVGG